MNLMCSKDLDRIFSVKKVSHSYSHGETLQYINYFRRLLIPPGSEVKAWQTPVWNNEEHLHLSQLWKAELDAPLKSL